MGSRSRPCLDEPGGLVRARRHALPGDRMDGRLLQLQVLQDGGFLYRGDQPDPRTCDRAWRCAGPGLRLAYLRHPARLALAPAARTWRARGSLAAPRPVAAAPEEGDRYGDPGARAGSRRASLPRRRGSRAGTVRGSGALARV